MITSTAPREVIPRRKPERKALLKRYRGLIEQVARDAESNPSIVSRVYHGLATSGRIRAAIENEIRRRIEAENTALAAKPNGAGVSAR